jgi:hypothetical protein
MLDKIEDYFPLYIKPEESEAPSNQEPNNSVGKIPSNEDQEEEELITRRKMSHS